MEPTNQRSPQSLAYPTQFEIFLMEEKQEEFHLDVADQGDLKGPMCLNEEQRDAIWDRTVTYVLV